jgi:endonuclease YncB( thermonuclease family)
MRKLIGVVVMTVAMLMLSRYGPALDAWGIQSEGERLATSGATERPARTEARAAAARPGPPSAITGRVVEVVDGDTITVRLGARTEIVKYIGVEATGTAADINRHFLAGGEVRLELDLVERDQAGRLLAYVHAGDVMMNAELVAQGAARVTTDSPNGRHGPLLRDLEQQAKILKVGIWGGRTPETESPRANRRRG